MPKVNHAKIEKGRADEKQSNVYSRTVDGSDVGEYRDEQAGKRKSSRDIDGRGSR